MSALFPVLEPLEIATGLAVGTPVGPQQPPLALSGTTDGPRQALAAALLPALDATTMGWAWRDWYLGPHRSQLFDTSGNAGATAWWEGRIVGGWRQSDSGEVDLQLLEDPGSEARQALEHEAARLSGWLHGVRVQPRFPSPLSKAAARAAGDV